MNLGELKAMIAANSNLPDSTLITIASSDHTFRVGFADVLEVLKFPNDTRFHEWTGFSDDFGYPTDAALVKAGGVINKVINIE
jgi:hypothetical protein